MKLNQLIAQALNKPVEALTIDDVNGILLREVVTFVTVQGEWDTPEPCCSSKLLKDGSLVIEA